MRALVNTSSAENAPAAERENSFLAKLSSPVPDTIASMLRLLVGRGDPDKV
jgi:hypothetical protein